MASDTPTTAATADASSIVSPFLDRGPRTRAGSLAILQLSRDNLLPIYLQPPSGTHDGYAEGHVVNTRYGSFPHSTMLDVPWGSQIRASMVDTGSRGKKRKRADADDATGEELDDTETTSGPGNSKEDVKEAITASSGFLHVLPPTPETWTISLPHRTQVVYTPDYSYILHRLRARPGTRLIEAGAGSGSFSHASARAVYNGYPTGDEQKGKVFSFEFHEQRYHTMKKDISDHGLEGIVQLTHRDVYGDGFGVEGQDLKADAVFLDLPAPWQALPHLTRRKPPTKGVNGHQEVKQWVSVLNPKKSVHICTFSPCIEQVTRTMSTMRRLGWVDLEMVEIAHRRFHTARERLGTNASYRSVNVSAKDVEEAVMKLAEIEEKSRGHRAKESGLKDSETDMGINEEMEESAMDDVQNGPVAEADPVPEWRDGQLVIRGDPEIKTHTSYLVFAVLPQEWTEEDEAAALAKWPVGEEKKVIGNIDKATRKREKRELLRVITEKKAQKKRQRTEADREAQIEVKTEE